MKKIRLWDRYKTNKKHKYYNEWDIWNIKEKLDMYEKDMGHKLFMINKRHMWDIYEILNKTSDMYEKYMILWDRFILQIWDK